MKNKADKVIRLFDIKDNRESKEESENKFKSIANCIADIKKGKNLSVTKIAEIANKILGINELDGAVMNLLLVDAKAQKENFSLINGIPSRYIPTELGSKYCEESNQKSYIFFLWSATFVLELLNINLDDDIDDEMIERIQKKLEEYHIYVDLDFDTVKANIQEFKKQIWGRR